jgi:hypothetical protein
MTAISKSEKPRIPSPWEFQKLAEASRDAADAAYADIQSRDAAFARGERNVEITFMAITVAFLYLRSVELALKAAILERGLAAGEVIPSPKLGHNLANLLDCATNGGTQGSGVFAISDLGLDQEGRDFLVHWSGDYANNWFEYHFGPFHYPDLGLCQRIANSVVEAIAPIATTDRDFREDLGVECA